MTTRSDIHRPSQITPEDYTFVGCDYYGPTPVITDRQHIRRHMERTGGKYSSHDHAGTCHICGAGAFSVAVFHHPKTNTYIVAGEDCAAKMDLCDPIVFRSLKKRLADGRKAEKGKAKARSVLHDLGLDKAWEVYQAEIEDITGRFEESTIRDIVHKLIRYGSISEAQSKFIGVLLTKIENRAEIEARRQAEHEAAKELPEGRLTFRAKVLTVKQTDFGRRLLLQHIDGWKCWGSVPSSLSEVERNAEIELTATLVKSDKDTKFGFFKRPTKAWIVEAGHEDHR
jgi:hypothetical protein